MFQSFLASFQSLLLTVVGIAGIGFLIVFHEFGHFIFSKMFGIRVQTFSIGFGPYLTSKKIGGTNFVVSAIPLGGYVDLGDQEGQAADKNSFTTRPLYQKAIVILGGIGFNVLFAYLAMSLVFMAGMPEHPALFPQNAIPVVNGIKDDSMAAKAGFKANDLIIAIDGQRIDNSVQKLNEILAKTSGDFVANSSVKTDTAPKGPEIKVTVLRGSETLDIPITLELHKFLDKTVGIIPGIGNNFKLISLQPLPILESFKRGIHITNTYIYKTILAFKHLIVDRDTSNIAGPVRIFSESAKGAAQGIKIFLIFLSLISISLAVFNLLPLPIVDGGRLLIYIFEAIIGREIPEKTKEYIFIGTWLLLLALTVYLIGKDIMHLAGDKIDKLLKFLKIR